MLKALVLILTVAILVASGVTLASAEDATKVYDLSRSETLVSEKLIILPIKEIETDRQAKTETKETPKS